MLLTTKFLAPAYNSRSVERRRLFSRLAIRQARKLVIVTAPAGYGKTTLVTQWLHESNASYCWLALDPSDDEPHRFWQYVVGSIQQQFPDIGGEANQLLAKTDRIPFEAVVTSLLNDIVSCLPHSQTPVSLIIDDFHLITQPQIHGQFIYLINFLPPQFQVILTSRVEPPLPISKWQVKNWVDEVYASELAFSLEESEQFFKDYMSLDLSSEQIMKICEKTEGWVAAMQLAALSSKDCHSHSDTQTPTQMFNGEDKLINDYVLSEILEQQPLPVQQFLLDSSCLFRLSGPLCDAIRNTNDSQKMLESLEQANLFIIPLDTSFHWFRYHDLFRESLFHRLRLSSPQQVKELQKKAIDWLLVHGNFHEATAQLIQLKDWEWLKKVLEEHGNTLIHQGHHLPVLDWLNQIPEELSDSAPRLLMLKIWALFFSNRINAIEPLLEQLQALLTQNKLHPEEDSSTQALDLHSEVALIRSYLARTKSDIKSATHLTKQVLEELDSSNMPLKSVTYYGIGIDCYSQGDLYGAKSALESAIHYGKIEKRHAIILSSSGLLAWVMYDHGQLDSAMTLCLKSQAWIDAHQQESNKPRLVSCWQNSALAKLYCERNEITVAQTYINPLLKHLENGTEAGQHIVIQYIQAHIHFANDAFQNALDCLNDALEVYQQKRESIMFFPPAIKALRIRCLLKTDNLKAALTCLEDDESQTVNPLNQEQNRLTAARVFIANKQFSDAMKQTRLVLQSAQKGEHISHIIEAHIVSALACFEQHDLSSAKSSISTALKMASRHGFVRLFRGESENIIACIKLADEKALPKTYIDQLSVSLKKNATTLEQKTANSAQPALSNTLSFTKLPSPLLEPLSQRENEVLNLINQGLANKEIAKKLNLAPATIKAHIRNLYGKIEAKSRTEALAKARSLGLLG